MEGYSVTEAASVLGVPTERVWELLARGVLAGAPEGETGMRVFLQPRPAPPVAEPKPANGGEPEPQRELSPFRELLSEFRNLTERYGQALLALGEARGEVAALRSRVDMLEARMDLRLPGGAPAAPPVGWTQPMPWQPPPSPTPSPEPEEEPASTAETEAMAGADASDDADAEPDREPGPEPETRAGRRSSPREAIASFAEALARAQDPSVPELPPAPETSGALTVRAGLTDGEETEVEAALPRELPPADEVPVADEAASADEAGSAEGEPSAAEEPQSIEEPQAAPEPPVSEASADETPGVGEAPGDGTPEPTEALDQLSEPDVEEAPDERPAWQDDRYTAEVGEPDWLEAEAYPPDSTPAESSEAPAETADEAPPDAANEAPTEEPAEETAAADAEPVAESPPPVEPSAPVEEPGAEEPAATDDAREPEPDDAASEETVMWFGRAADEMETAPGAGRTADLDDAFAALEELSRATPPRATPPRATPPRETETRTPSPATQEPDPVRTRPESPTPAGRAYRRLRRIFPG